MFEKRRGQIKSRFIIFTLGLLIMSLGIVLSIKSGAGATPWDVLHVGLFYHYGLTVGSWSVLAGFAILISATLISKEFPNIGAFLNMLLVGVFIDLYMMIPFLQEPGSLTGKITMFTAGLVLMAYGMGIYISASLGTGPRDSLMAAIVEKTGWKIRNVRSAIELVVLLIGWRLGGPVSWGTVAFCLAIGPLAGVALPQCYKAADRLLGGLKRVKLDETVEISKGA